MNPSKDIPALSRALLVAIEEKHAVCFPSSWLLEISPDAPPPEAQEEVGTSLKWMSWLRDDMTRRGFEGKMPVFASKPDRRWIV